VSPPSITPMSATQPEAQARFDLCPWRECAQFVPKDASRRQVRIDNMPLNWTFSRGPPGTRTLPAGLKVPLGKEGFAGTSAPDAGPARTDHAPDAIKMPSPAGPAPSQIVPKIPKTAGESGFGHKNDGRPRGATVLSRRRSGKHPMTHCAPTKCSPRGGRRPWGSTLGSGEMHPRVKGGSVPIPRQA
jgi:hypothetical protein